MLFSFLFSVSEIIHVPFAVWHSFASFVKFFMRIIPNVDIFWNCLLVVGVRSTSSYSDTLV